MKLHLGCGMTYIPGFIHVDVIKYPHVDYVQSIDNLSDIFCDNSISLIYCCHVLEHFHRKRVLNVLNEWYRILEPSGILRISVPDFEKLCEVYTETKDINYVIGPIIGRQDYLYNVHYNIFDYNSLEKALLTTGFSIIRRYDWRDTEHSNVDDYSQAYIPHMDKENGKLISLNVEAIK